MDTLVITGVRFNPPPGCVYEVLSDPWMLLKDNKNLFLSGKRPKSNCLGNSIFWLLPALVYLDLFECNSFENILFEESRQEILQSRIDMVSARKMACFLGIMLNSSNSVSAINGHRPYTKQYNVTPKAQTSIAFVIGGLVGFTVGLTAKPVTEELKEFALGIGETINDVCEAEAMVGDSRVAYSPRSQGTGVNGRSLFEIHISSVLPNDTYWRSRALAQKRPDFQQSLRARGHRPTVAAV